MSWDSVPWFIGGGALHSPEVARLLAFSATSGAEGVVAPTDLKVTALGTPGGSVNVAIGAALVLNRSTGGAQQTYIGRNPSQDTVAIAPTAGAWRYDLIVARVEDPFMVGTPWVDPTDVTVGPYVFTRVISNVGSTVTTVAELGLGYSAVALARIAVPPSTAAITAGMITDLRTLVNPRSQRVVLMGQPSAQADLTSATIVNFPATYTPTVAIPKWATRATVIAHFSGIDRITGNTVGFLWTYLGTAGSPPVGYDVNGTADPSRDTYLIAGTFDVSAVGGTNQIVKIMGRRDGGPGAFRIYGQTTVVFDVDFTEGVI